jgi:DNA-binding transcriptional MerR regulator
MRIGEAASESGASARALRYYEDEGLIVPGRCGNGYRDYCRSTVDRVVLVRSLLESGLPVRLIREALPHLAGDATRSGPDTGAGAGDGTDAARAEFLREVRGYRDRLAARIAALCAQQDALDAYLRDPLIPAPTPLLDLDASVKVLPSPYGEQRGAAERRPTKLDSTR